MLKNRLDTCRNDGRDRGRDTGLREVVWKNTQVWKNKNMLIPIYTKTGYPTPAISSMSNDEEIDDHPKDLFRMATQYETGVNLW